MKKKHRHRAPDFARPNRLDRQKTVQAKPAAAQPAPRVKPQSTSAKSGRRGQ